MLLNIQHRTTYRYSQPVYLDSYMLRLRPRCDGTQQLRRFAVHVTPQPSSSSESCDIEGNAVTNVWFSGITQELTVISSGEVETHRSNPFDYILADTTVESLPLQYAPDLSPAVAVYCPPMASSEEVTRFAVGIANDTGKKTLPFLSLLVRRITESCQYIVREVGDPLPAEVTLTQRKGSCRDFTVLFMEACRAVGIAARFVSGYQVPFTDQIHQLHAWAEVYLPGGGWRGYDPTAGLAVGDHHIVVAAGSTPRMAAPISGSFRGENITTTLEVDIQLRPADGDTFSPLAL